MLKSKLMKSVMMGVVAAFMVSTVNAQAVKVTGASVDLTSKYVWRGFELFGSNPAWQPSVDMALFDDSGLGLNVWGSFPIGSGAEEATELDYTLSWGTSIGEDATQVDLGVNFIYYDYPQANSTWDVWELGVSADMPNLLPMGIGLSYYTGYGELVDGFWADGNTGEDFDASSAQYHSIGVGKDLEIDDTYSLSLSADVNYNNDMFNAGSTWSHSTFGASVGGLECPYTGASITPFVYYQSALEDKYVDSLFGGVSVGLEF